MTDTALTLIKIKTISFYCLLLLLVGCATVDKQPAVAIESAEKLIKEAKTFQPLSLVKEELLNAEKSLLKAKEAVDKGNKQEAYWFAEKALSDAEYAKAKISVVVYGNVAKRQEESLKKYQEIYNQK